MLIIFFLSHSRHAQWPARLDTAAKIVPRKNWKSCCFQQRNKFESMTRSPKCKSDDEVWCNKEFEGGTKISVRSVQKKKKTCNA